jgi:hypothetical protein
MNISKDDLRDMSLSPEILLILGHLLDRIESLETKDKPKRKTFQKPTKEEVGEYMLSKGSFDAIGEAERFYNFYESNGWKVGKNKMVNWRSSAAGWLSRQNKNQPSLPMGQPTAKQKVRAELQNITDTSWWNS